MLLQKRSNGIFYFRWVYPVALRKLTGKREMIKSLRTTSKTQALARAGAYYMAVEDIKKTAPLEGDILDAVDKTELYRIYKNELPKLLEISLDCTKLFKADSLTAANRIKAVQAKMLEIFRVANSNQAGEYADGKSIYSVTKKRLDKAAKMQIPNPNEFLAYIGKGELIKLFEDSGLFSAPEEVEPKDLDLLNVPPTVTKLEQGIVSFVGLIAHVSIARIGEKFKAWPELYDLYIRDVTQMYHIEANEIYKALHSDEVDLPRIMRPKKADASQPPAIDRQPTSILFSKLLIKFLNYKIVEENLTEKMQADYMDYEKIFLFALGDRPVDTITKNQVTEVLKKYQKLPKRNLKAYKDEPIELLWDKAVPEKDRISLKTRSNAQKYLSAVFRFAVNQSYLTQSPASDLPLKTKLVKKRGHFSDTEVRKIFDVLDTDSHIQKNPWQKWAVLFGAYTGARAGEIMGLQKQDFKQDEESCIWLVTIRGTKTANALRKFPLSQELIDKGFLDFVKSSSERIFPSDKSNKAITAFFPRVLKAAGISTLNDINLRRSFHSLRHSVVTKARGAGLSEVLVQQVVGHEKRSAGVTDTYTHTFTPEQLLSVVNVIKY